MQERSSKVIAIVALCVGVVGLSLGFAAFTSNLTVSSVGATYTPSDAQFVDAFGFDVNPKGGTVSEKFSKAWTGVTAEFTGLNQTKEFTATVVNESPYLATTANKSFTLEQTKCEAAEGATVTQEYVTEACKEITATVTMPETVARDNGTGTATVTVVGPKNNAVDGAIVVEFKAVVAQYTTAQ